MVWFLFHAPWNTFAVDLNLLQVQAPGVYNTRWADGTCTTPCLVAFEVTSLCNVEAGEDTSARLCAVLLP